MEPSAPRIAVFGIVFCAALAIEAFGVVAFLRVDPDTGALSIRTISPFWLLVGWAALKSMQGYAAYLWNRHTPKS